MKKNYLEDIEDEKRKRKLNALTNINKLDTFI